jgi:hypothetical protein
MSCFRLRPWVKVKINCQNSIYWCKQVIFGVLSHFIVGLLHVTVNNCVFCILEFGSCQLCIHLCKGEPSVFYKILVTK